MARVQLGVAATAALVAVAAIAAGVALAAPSENYPRAWTAWRVAMDASKPDQFGGLPTQGIYGSGNKYYAQVMGGEFTNGTVFAGQEVRTVVVSAYASQVSLFKAKRLDGLRDAANPGSVARDDASARRYISGLLNASLLPAFNVTGPNAVRVRVISAGTSRSTAVPVTPVACTAGASHDVWAEFHAMSPRQVVFGKYAVFSGFVTFTAPPFAFRLCVKDVQTRNVTKRGDVRDPGANSLWTEFGNQRGRSVKVSEPALLWRLAGDTALQAGDQAAFEIVTNANSWEAPQARALNTSGLPFTSGDSVKLVPSGYPCTYERRAARVHADAAATGAAAMTYCGAGQVQVGSGAWVSGSVCETEGSVANGVARVGSRTQNPFQHTSVSITDTLTARDHLVAYLTAPAAGSYDVCVSPKLYRRVAARRSGLVDTPAWGDEHSWYHPAALTAYASYAQPVWIKAYDASASDCQTARGYDRVLSYAASCAPRKAELKVAAATSTITWQTVDETPGTWGEMKFTASSGTLNYNAASQWEFAATANHFNLTGGDQFRLVPEYYFSETATMTSGDMTATTTIVTVDASVSSKTTSSVARTAVSFTSGTALSTAGQSKYTEYALGTPNYGSKATVGTGSGCWWAGADNYGSQSLFGAPSSCGSICTTSDTDGAGATASANLGGDPRVDYSPWARDGTGTNAWAYIRVPAAGTYRVCYRKAGQSAWRALKGTMATRASTSNTTFTPRALNSGYTYHFNDTRAETWGPVAIRSLSGATLTKEAWNYYTASTATAVGSALKIVQTTQSCYTGTAESRTYSMNPGSAEMAGSLGSADDSTTAVSMVYFYVKLPKQLTTSIRYRICFRRAGENWHALNDPNAQMHLYMSSGTAFNPQAATPITFSITDRQAGSWGQLVFNRSDTATPAFNTMASADWVRLVPNVTSTGVEVNCDVVYGTTTDLRGIAQTYSAAMTDTDLDVACAVTSSVATDPCYSGTLTPTSNSVSATYPYTDVSPGSDVAGLRNLDGTAAYITVPAGVSGTRPVAYKVCYKNARFANWVEATNLGSAVMTVTTARTVTAAAASTTVWSGAYTYVTISATATGFPVNTATDLVKLVPFASTCDVPAAANAGYELYTALSGVPSSTSACLVDAANSTTIQGGCSGRSFTATARAYMVMPTVRTAGGSVTNYRVCYMARSSTTDATANWHDVSGTTAFAVTNHGIVYTALNKPYTYGQLRLKITSAYALLNTNSGQDSAKIVSQNVVCAATTSTDQPSGATSASLHMGREVGYATSGVTDLGPGDLANTREARLDVVLQATTSFKVCYQPAGQPWLEVLQAQGSERVYALTSDYITPTSGEVTAFTVSSQLTQSGSTATAIGGSATTDGTNNWLTLTYSSAPTAGQSHTIKFVQYQRLTTAGAYATVRGQSDCWAVGQMTTFTTVASTTQNMNLNLPLESGKYLVCVWSSATSTWYQPATASAAGQPLVVAANRMGFIADATAGTLTVQDWYSSTTTNYGGLAGADNVYIINATTGAAACGSTADWQSVARTTAQVNMSTAAHGVDTTNFLASRMATIALPAAPRTGRYVVCYQRSQAASTNASGVAPILRAGWYQLGNIGTTLGAGTSMLVLTAASKLNVTSCPVFNATYRVRTGRPVDVTVRAEDANSNLADTAPRTAVTAVGAGYTLQGFGGECAEGNAATYGYTSAALTQFMRAGQARFTVTPLSACPSGTCTLSFTSAAGLTASQTCSFGVQPTTVAAVRFVTTPTSCNMGSWCWFRVVALHSDGGVAHTVTSGVQLTVAGWTATTAVAETAAGSGFSIQGGSTSFVNGEVYFRVRFQPSGYSATASQTVTLTATANGKTSPTVSFTVHRPVLAGIHVVDVYPMATAGAPLLPLQPTWEPSTAVWSGGDALGLGSAAVSAGTGYHLVAGQAYVVQLRATATTNGVTGYAMYSDIVPSGSSVAVDSTFLTTIQALQNDVLRGSASAESDSVSLGSVSWPTSATSLNVALRFKNAFGCAYGCTVPLAFTGVTGITSPSITTPVRSVATRLRIDGCATTLAGLASSTASSCTGVTSTVNQGWFVNVSAVDDFGGVDSFFNGEVLAVLTGASEAAAAARGVKLTTVTALALGAMPPAGHVRVAASNGRAVVQLTTSRPCPAGVCDLQLLSTWGTGVLSAGWLVSTPNTDRLHAVLNTVLAYCDATSTTECTSVAGVSRANETHARSLIYKDTRVCANVMAVDTQGRSTLYETNWIGYFVRDKTAGGAQALTVTDDASRTSFVQRYKPLKNSAASFCFTISGFTSPRDVEVHFVAQRFGTQATYWSHGAKGTAMLGPMKVWPKKLIAAVLLSGSAGGDVVSGGATGAVSASYTGSPSTVTLNFELKDHYNNSIVAAETNAAEQAKYLQVRLNASRTGAEVAHAGSMFVRGNSSFGMNYGSSALNVSATPLRAAFDIDSGCLGCTVSLDLVDQGGIPQGTMNLNGVVAYPGSNVTFYIVNQDTALVRKLAFNPGTSPLTSYWVNGTATTATSNTAPTYHVASCFASTTSCAPNPASLNLASCDSRGTTNLGSSASAGLKMRVYAMPSATSLSSALEVQDHTSQVDIMNTYTVSVSFGNQLLSCLSSGAACANDNTAAPQQTLLAYGATVRGAIGQFVGATDSGIRSTDFHVVGLSTSAYLAINSSTSTYDSAPAVGGAFSASAAPAAGSATVTGLSMTAGSNFYWRPVLQARKFTLLSTAKNGDACNESATYPYYTSASVGVPQMAKVDTLALAYASQSLPVGVAIPFTVEVQDVSGFRIAGASGSVAAAVSSWAGCNNGGAPTATGAVANGRATVWVTFTAPCEKCVLSFKLTPAASEAALYGLLATSPGQLTVFSSEFTVVKAAQAATHVVASAATPAAALTSGATVALTVADAVQVTLTPRANVGTIPYATTASTTAVTVSAWTTTSANWWAVGNGGVLRPSLTATSHAHYQVALSMTAETSTSAYFTRTCAGCRLRVGYLIDGTTAGSFSLPATFAVTTAASQLTLVGFAPRSVRVGVDTAIALWSTGSENAATIPVAGLAPATTVGTAATPSFAATNASNGDGGRLTATPWVFNNTQVHRLSFSAPCDTCTVSAGGNSFAVRVLTTATHLRPGPDATLSTADILAGVARPATRVAQNAWRVVPVLALDDLGFVDQAAGVRTCEFPARRFQCPTTGVPVSVSLSANGAAAGGFPVSGNDQFIFADGNGVSAAQSTMYFGRVHYNFSFTRPQRAVIPIFSATVGASSVSSALTATRAFPVPKYSVSVGTTGLSLNVVSSTAVASLTQNVANTFHVALVGAHASSASARYVAVDADNAVSVTASAGCPAHTVNASGSTLAAGYATFVVTFTAATTTGTPCTLTFAAGAGAGSCATAADCSNTQTVVVAALQATRFSIVRPTVDDNGVGSTVGPMYAHAGRAMRIRAAILGAGATTGSLFPVTSCTTCTLSIASSDCNLASSPVSATPAAGASFAEASVVFGENPTTPAATYTCSITVTMTAGTASLVGPDGSATSVTYSVSVCKSASVKLLTNTSEAYRGMLLRTGVAYEFYAVMQTAAGTQCRGDSQDDATALTLSVVNAATSQPVPTLTGVNVNATSTTTAAFANGNMAAAARQTVTAVGGAFRFAVVFTNSTAALGLTQGVRVRIAAAGLNTVVSGPVHTVVAASQLRFGPEVAFPMYAVQSRAMEMRGPGPARTGVSVSAVDGLPEAWSALGFTSGVPNVARGPTEVGSDAEVFWRVAPTPSASEPFPLRFTGGAASATLARGRATWDSVAWTGADGVYGLSVAAVPAGIAATPAVTVTTQTVRQLMLDTRGFTTNPPSAPTCTSSCVLPNGTFTTMQNATINGGQPFLSVPSLTEFNLTVLVTDGAMPVMGDNASVVAITLNANAGTSVQLGAPPAYQQRGTVYARVQAGRATLRLGLLGDTLMAGGAEQFASLTVSCPATRPAELLRPGESATNPCSLTGTVATQTFQVVDKRARAAVLNSAVVTAARRVVKASLGLDRFQLVNLTLFKDRLLPALRQRGVGYLTRPNLDRVLMVTTCTVNTLFPTDGDLGSTVCGASQTCAAPNNLASCPNGVEACSCPSLAPRTLLLSRFLLQNGTSGNGTSTKLELGYELHRADTFPATTAAEVAAEYERVQLATVDALSNDPELVNGFQIQSVSTRSASALVTTVAPTTQPPVNPPPVVPPPPGTNPPPPPTTTSAASPLALALAALLAALVALLA